MVSVINEYLTYTENCFDKYMKMIFDTNYNKKLVEPFIDTYISIRYSDYLDESNKKLSLLKKISKGLDLTCEHVVSENTDDAKLVESIRIFIGYFYYLDQLYLLESQKKIISTIASERKKLLGISDAKFETELGNEVRNDIKKRKEFLENFESSTFSVELNEFDTNKYLVSLKDDITFPDLYSDVAIERTREKDVINGDYTQIKLLQVSSIVINNFLSCDFEKTYYVDLPKSFFDKKTKLNRLIKTIDSVYIQDKIILVVTYACFKRYKTYVTELMRSGFIIAIKLDDSFDYNSENIEFMELFEKIFINSDKYYYKDMKKNVKIKNRVVSIGEV